MKRLLLAAVLGIAALPSLAADVGVSITVGQPGFYGRIDIGDFPRPRLVFPEPVIVERVTVHRPPLYLHVPPGHAKHWSKHCHEYHACGERVYFVDGDWYEREYVPAYQARHRGHGDARRDDRRDDRRDARRDDRRDDRGGDRGGDRGKGNGHRGDDR